MNYNSKFFELFWSYLETNKNIIKTNTFNLSRTFNFFNDSLFDLMEKFQLELPNN
jgi:hypothetical protein